MARLHGEGQGRLVARPLPQQGLSIFPRRRWRGRDARAPVVSAVASQEDSTFAGDEDNRRQNQQAGDANGDQYVMVFE